MEKTKTSYSDQKANFQNRFPRTKKSLSADDSEQKTQKPHVKTRDDGADDDEYMDFEAAKIHVDRQRRLKARQIKKKTAKPVVVEHDKTTLTQHTSLIALLHGSPPRGMFSFCFFYYKFMF
jgi:hypothetical protein